MQFGSDKCNWKKGGQNVNLEKQINECTKAQHTNHKGRHRYKYWPFTERSTWAIIRLPLRWTWVTCSARQHHQETGIPFSGVPSWSKLVYLSTKGSLLVFLILQSELDVTFLMRWLTVWGSFTPPTYRKEIQHSSNKEHHWPNILHSTSSQKRGKSRWVEAAFHTRCCSNALGDISQGESIEICEDMGCFC